MSLTQQLRLLRNRAPSAISASQEADEGSSSSPLVLFSRQSATAQHDNLNLTYEQCWHFVDEHRQWLVDTVDNQRTSAVAATNNNRDRVCNEGVHDVIIGYLADNSPDLLLSVLACIDLTTNNNGGKEGGRGRGVLPAMINGRWTPLEIERALRPSSSSTTDRTASLQTGGVHVTIVLYGAGYEHTANEAVRLMNQQTRNGTDDGNDASTHHFAVAMPLPEFAKNYNSTGGVLQTATSPNHERESQHACNNNNKNHISIYNSIAILLFTSGTSSPRGAKGVRLSHRSLLLQAYAKTQSPCNYDSDTNVVATTVPWFHVGGISSALGVILGGGCLVFPPAAATKSKKGFQPEIVLKLMVQPTDALSPSSTSFKVANTLVVVPAMLHAMVQFNNLQQQKHLEQKSSCYSNVKLILVGGQSIGNGKLYLQTRKLFPKARIVQTYACTEAGSSITFEDLGWPDGICNSIRSSDSKKIGNSDDGIRSSVVKSVDNGATCVGLPPTHVQIAIFDAAITNHYHGRYVPQPPLLHGRMGIIATRGPHVMSGYWNRDGNNNGISSNNANSNNITSDGWMFTNDLGYIDPQNGKLYFCGRANDVIRTGGESVLANEVERVLETHSNIVECAVFALPDDKFGEAVCAAIVLVEDETKAYSDGGLGAVAESEQWTQQIREYCAKHQLAGFKRPRRVFCMLQALPRNSSGKVLKHEIIRLCAAQSKENSRL